MKNRLLALIALLAANDRLGQPEVHRTTIVKQAFLLETLRPLYKQWFQTFKFVRYRYGPYSEDVFSLLDVLIFNGFVTVTSAQVSSGRVEARYRITDGGHSILTRVGHNQIVDLSLDLVWALQCLGVQRVNQISKLVYQEPEFSRLYSHQSGLGIGPEAKTPLPAVTAANNQTLITLSVVQELLRNEDPAIETDVSSREAVRLFLSLLAEHAGKQESMGK
jgi:hypothetical protein